MPKDNPETLAEWLEYVIAYEKDIFVREINSAGKWDSIPLSDLTPDKWAKHVSRWLDEGVIPVRVVRKPEEQ